MISYQAVSFEEACVLRKLGVELFVRRLCPAVVYVKSVPRMYPTVAYFVEVEGAEHPFRDAVDEQSSA